MSTKTNHGLTATNPARTPAERARFTRFRTAQLECLDPRDATEAYLAERIVFHRWLLLKCDQAEAAALSDVVWADEHPPLNVCNVGPPEVTGMIRALREAARPPEGPILDDHRAALAFSSNQVQKICRYRAEHERSLDRVEAKFAHYRKSRILIGLPTDENPTPRSVGQVVPPKAGSPASVLSSDAASGGTTGGSPASAQHPPTPATPKPLPPSPAPRPVTATPRKLSKPPLPTKPVRRVFRLNPDANNSCADALPHATMPQTRVGAPFFAQGEGWGTDTKQPGPEQKRMP